METPRASAAMLSSLVLDEDLYSDGETALFRGRTQEEGTAVLVLAPVVERPSPAVIGRLEHEFALRDELAAPWSARPLTLLRHGESVALVLRDPGGVPWSVLLRRPLSVVEAVWMGAATAAALAEVHSRGIVHTNLKPEHILVDLNRQAVSLIGFGLAVRPARTAPEDDPPQALAGTLAYMPPEQTGRMTSGVDTRSDLYALGVVLYQTLTGTLPFTASDPLELIHAHLARQAIPPVARNPAVPALLSDLVMRLLAKTPDERYQTAGGLAWDLRHCLEGFERPGPIDPFPLGEHDVPDRLRLPDRLHGRERQLEELQVAWQGVCDGRGPTLALVSGAPGTGKTRLVEKLGREVRRSDGLFAAGKFTQYEPGVPHATMAEVLRALLRGVLATPEQEVARWRDGVAEAIGADGRVLMEMVPELAHLLGPQGPVPDLPARDAQNRFRAVAGQLLSALATADQPVAVFLDDLQWVDAETAGLLSTLLSHPGMQHLLLVGAYRSEEVTAEHPLAAVVRAIRATGAAVREIGLAPLDRGDLAALVADMLRISLDRAEPLAQLVHNKTDGNPFFAQQLLTSLHEEGLVVFLGGEGGWTWDLQGIRAKGFTDNVLELLSRKLGRLSAPAQDALKTLAMLGMRAPLELLGRALQAPPARVRQQLREAAQSGLVDCDDHECAFVHDRIREAAYALVTANERARRHLELGRLLLADRRIEDIDEDLFALANHFRQALVLVDDVTEREGVRRLTFRAGKTAKLAIAFDAARDYFADAIALLPGNRWTAPYEEVFALVGELTECEYLLGNLDRGNALFHELLAQARSDLDRAAVYRIRIVNFSAPPGTLPELLALILEALRFLGVDCPAGEQALVRAIRADEDLIATRLRNRPITDLANAPAIVDPRVAAAVDLLADTTALTRHSPRHAEWLTLQGLKLCLAHGHVPSSPMIYAFYAVHLASLPGSIQRALAFSDLAVALDKRYGDLRWRPAVLSMYAGLVHSWGRPFRLARPFFDEAFSTAQLVWDRRFAPGLGMVAVWTEIEAATPIAKARAASKRYLDFTARVGSFFSNLCRQYVQFLACLEGQTTGLLSFDGPDFKEEEAVTLYRNSGYGSGVRQLWTLKLMAAVLLGQQDEASQYSVALRQMPTTLGSTIGAAEAFFHAMAAAMEYGKAAPDERAELAAAVDDVVSRLERWAADCPANFLSRYQLVLAEKARIEGRHLEALHLYDDAIASAREQGLLHTESLACERAARFYLDQGLSRNAYAHLRDARAGYAQWGATAKVALLDREFPQIDKPADAGPSSTRGSPQAQIDLSYVVKAFQTLSGEIELDKLVQALLRLVLEQAGADRALLILSRSDGGYSIEAEAEMGPEGHRVQIGRAPLDSGQLPETVFRYVARTRESVLLDDAATSTLFVEDDYLLRQKPRSVLCLPLLKQAHLAGVLYLENHLAPGVFSPARVSTLEMIASQAAISLETARLYGDLATERSHLAAIIRQVPVGLAIAEAPSGRILVANQAARDLTGAADHLPDSVAEYSLYYGFHPDGRRYEPDEWPLARALLTGEVVTGEEIEMLWGDGRLGCLAVSAGPMHDAEGRISAAVVVLQDITERRRREEALRASEERFSKAFFNNPTAMAVLRRKDWTFVEANEGFGALLGREKSELLGAAGGELGTWFRTLLEQAARRLAEGGTFREQEVAATDNAGQSRTLLVSFDTIEVKGEPCFLATFADLTKRKRVDEQLRQSQKMDAIGSLAGGVAHDFNNLLTAINGYSDLMLNRLRDSDPNFELVRSIRAAGERAAGLTRQLLAFSRKERLETSVQSLNVIVEKMEDLLRRMVEENVVLTTRLDPAAGLINANGAQVEQILLNLVINARDAMPSGGEVRIETHNVVLNGPLSKALMPMVAGLYVALEVTDAGMGIAPEVMTKIFEPFFTTKVVGKGTGLGLAVVYGVVKGLQGGIEVDSVPGQGTTVRVYLPQAPQDGVPPRESIPSPAAAGFPGRETVLVVEDEPTVRKLIRHVLADLGYHVLTASNGLEALTIVEQGQAVDVLVTDLVMPGLGGRELAARVRERSPTLPILFMSGYSADVGIDQDVLSIGENFLAKPFTPGDLARKVREILDRR